MKNTEQKPTLKQRLAKIWLDFIWLKIQFWAWLINLFK